MVKKLAKRGQRQVFKSSSIATGIVDQYRAAIPWGAAREPARGAKDAPILRERGTFTTR
jgi:hypothetical protein